LLAINPAGRASCLFRRQEFNVHRARCTFLPRAASVCLAGRPSLRFLKCRRPYLLLG
jgi:hypothetical protein